LSLRQAARVDHAQSAPVCRPFRASPSATRYRYHHRHIPELTSGFNGIDEAGVLFASDKRRVLRQVVFGAVLVVYVVLVMLTVSAVREVPLDQLPDVAVQDGSCKITDDHGHDISSK